MVQYFYFNILKPRGPLPFANISFLQYLTRVGHRVLLHSERIILLRSFKEHNVLLRPFLEFLVT